jgi:hypothetical protein
LKMNLTPGHRLETHAVTSDAYNGHVCDDRRSKQANYSTHTGT